MDVNLLEILVVMLVSTLFSIGGGSGQIAVIQGRWVEPGTLPPELFSFALAITYIGPGPRTGFVAGVGYYLAGFPGAAVAVLGTLIPTVLGAGGVNRSLQHMERVIAVITPCAPFVIAALIAAAGWGVGSTLNMRPLEVAAAAGVAAVIGWRKTDPMWFVLAAVGTGVVLSLAL